MVDVKDLMNEKMKNFMREMAVSISNDIKETMKESMKTTNNEQQISLTPTSQPELITKDIPQPSPRVAELNDLIEEMDIGKSPNKRETPTQFNDDQNQDIQEVVKEPTSEPSPKTRTGARKSRINKTLQKGHTQSLLHI